MCAVLTVDCWFLGSGLVVASLFRFSILCVFCFSLDCFLLVLFAFVVLGLFSSVLCQQIGWEEPLSNDLFYVEWDVKTSLEVKVV